MKRSSLLAVLFAFLTFASSLHVADQVFERLPHLEDEFLFIYQAKVFEGGNIYLGRPEPRFTFWQPFLIECSPSLIQKFDLDPACENRQFSKYPPLWSMWLMFGYIWELPWVVNAFFAMLTVALTYRLAREIYSEATGVIAAALLWSSPIALLLNATYMNHTSALFFTTLFLYGLWRLEKGKGHAPRKLRSKLLWGLCAGLGLGMLIGIRPFTGMALAIPFVAYSGVRVLIASTVSVYRRWQKQQANADLLAARWAEPLPQSVRVIILGVPIVIATLVAYWIADQLEYKREFLDTINPEIQISAPEFGVLAIGMIVFFRMVYYVLIQSPTPERVPSQNAPWSTAWALTLFPLLALSAMTLFWAASVPLYNDATTGKATQNLYLMIWDYDKVGFGTGHGRPTVVRLGTEVVNLEPALVGQVDIFGVQVNQWERPEVQVTILGNRWHTWDRAKNTFKKDSACYSRDLLGWVNQPDDPPTKPIPNRNECMTDRAGLGWILLPLGIILWWRKRWTYLLLLGAVFIIGSTLWYWIGAGVYSARYYYEATSILMILSAAGITGIVYSLRRFKFELSYGVYMLVVILIGSSLIGYSPKRLDGLYRFGNVGRDQVEAVDHLRQDSDKPVLIIAYGEAGLIDSSRWRRFAALLALSSPYFDSEYLLARDKDKINTPLLIERFADREVIYFYIPEGATQPIFSRDFPEPAPEG